jgi:hypothetical protein
MLSLAAMTLALVSVVCASTPAGAFAQQQQQQDEDDTFFSGTLDEVTSESILVTREVLGNPAEHKTFALTAQTRVEGKLAEGARVTVKFRVTDDGAVAETIIVRDLSKLKKKS